MSVWTGPRLYWRPAGASRMTLLLLALLSLLALAVSQACQREIRQDDYEAKFDAARRAHQAFEAIRRERIRRGHPVDPATDPANTGLIGVHGSPVTSATGSLVAKQTSANPNFAAVVVDYLLRLNVKEGDVVAVGFSGSFPALNVSVLSALRALHLEPIAISSAAASDWGANLPDFMWLDMERFLAKEGLFNSVSVAASMGGVEDAALGLTREGRHLLIRAIERNEVAFLPPETIEAAIDRRMALYEEAASGRSISAYINVGGGILSVGGVAGKRAYRPGLNRPMGKAPVDSVMGRFLNQGVPVVHLVHTKDLAAEHGLPFAPKVMPLPGEGEVFRRTEPNRVLIGALLVGLCGAIVWAGRRSRASAHLKEAGVSTEAEIPPPSSRRVDWNPL